SGTLASPIDYVDFRNYNTASSGPTDTANNFNIGSMEITAVPEPSSLALLGMGALSLLFYRRRKYTNCSYCRADSIRIGPAFFWQLKLLNKHHERNLFWLSHRLSVFDRHRRHECAGPKHSQHQEFRRRRR